MDRVEILLDGEPVDGYVELLFEKVEVDLYPSKQLARSDSPTDAERSITGDGGSA